MINSRLYFLKRTRRGYILHEAKEDLLMLILACSSIFGVARVFIVVLN